MRSTARTRRKIATRQDVKDVKEYLNILIDEAENGSFWKPITSYASVLFILKQRWKAKIQISSLKEHYKEEVENLKELYEAYFIEQIIMGDPKETRNLLEIWKTNQNYHYGAKILHLQKENEKLKQTTTNQYALEINIAEKPMKRTNDIGDNNESKKN